jgi:hypothetical protein
MLPSWCIDSVTVIRAPMVAIRGTFERDWSRATSHTVSGCSLQGTSTSTNRNDPRDAAVSAAQLFAPPNADIEEGDRIQLGGHVYSVDGFALSNRSPFGSCDHTLCFLTEWRG